MIVILVIPCDKNFNGWKTMASTVCRHKKTIFNYFDAPSTNAFVEGLNSVIRSISDEGRGYDFDILRGKVLLSAGRKRKIPKPNFNVLSFSVPKQLEDFGVPFDGILDALKKGVFLSSHPPRSWKTLFADKGFLCRNKRKHIRLKVKPINVPAICGFIPTHSFSVTQFSQSQITSAFFLGTVR